VRADVIVSMLAQHMDDGALPAEELSRRTLVPTGSERLRAGDALTLAGSHEAIVAAREVLADRT
jgi:Trk K+ transport system NAD-binding subunit